MDVELKSAIFGAAKNWLDWQADFEFSGPVSDMPVLRDEARYRRFLREWVPFRQRTFKVHAMEVRAFLRTGNHLEDVVADETGLELDRLATEMATRFPDIGAPRSALSKLAMFYKPDAFSPWDQFARAGAAKACHHRNSRYDGGYSKFLADVNWLRASNLGGKIRQIIAAGGQLVSFGPGFDLRALDLYLMDLGRLPPIPK